MGQERTRLLGQCPPGPQMFCQGCMQGELRRGFLGWGGEPGKRDREVPSQVWEHHLCPVSQPAPPPASPAAAVGDSTPEEGRRACTGAGGEGPCPVVCLVSCAVGVELVGSLA